MMGSLAAQDTYYDPLTGLPIGAPQVGPPPELPPDLSQFAMGSAQNAYRPFKGSAATGRTPWQRMDIEELQRDAPRDPTGGDPATTKYLGQLAADALIPTEPWEYGMMAAGPAGRVAGKLGKTAAVMAGLYGSGVDEAEAAKWTKYPFNNIGVGDTLANLAKLNKHVSTKDIIEKQIQPHDIPVGSWLTPLIGDRSRSGELVTHIGEKELRNPVQMQGGYQFMPEWQKEGVAWASDRSPISAIAGRVNKFPGRDNTEVFGVYSPMSPQSIDASHHVSDAVSQLMHLEKDNISKTAIEKFDDKAEKLIPNFPGVGSDKLQDFLRDQTMTNRNKFVKLMNSRSAREEGFPDVEQARLALTHPDLIDTPSYAGGQSIASLKGTTSHGRRSEGVAPHHTYASKLHGDYTGGLPGALPPELLWRDLLPKIAARDPSAAGKIWLTGLKGEHFGQRVDPQWQDAAAEYYRRNPRGD
jgi:hypothetical protein